MNWKSTALVSGASVLAAWLGVSSSPGGSQPPTPAARTGRVQPAAADIQEQATHLQTRLHAQTEYAPPVRNPFRFGERTVPSRTRVAAPRPGATEPLPALPVAPPFTLAGIGASEIAGTMQYTAVLSTPAGVVLAHQGDALDGGFHVEAIDAGGVTVRAADGTVSRLSLPQ